MHTLHIGKWLEYYFQRQFALSNHQFSNISSYFRFYFIFLARSVIAVVDVVVLLLHHIYQRICASLHVNILKTELCYVEIMLQHRATCTQNKMYIKAATPIHNMIFSILIRFVFQMNSIGITISRSTCWPCNWP